MGIDLTAGQIAAVCGGHIVHGAGAAIAEGISTDTRSLEAGQAFFALIGPNHDAHAYVPQALATGAPIAVVQRVEAAWSLPREACVVQVEDTSRALLALAAWHRSRLNAKVLAVTGSCGKTTVKRMLGDILDLGSQCTIAHASFNNRIGVSRTLLDARPDDDFVVLEMGTNHPGEIDELASAAKPDLGIITTIGRVHLEGLGDLQGVREAKAELIPHLARRGTLVLNADDPLCISLAERFSGTTLTFALDAKATVRAERLHVCGKSWQFHVDGHPFRLHAGGRHNVRNAAAAICAAKALGVCAGAAAAALAGCALPPLRYERAVLGGVMFVNDCYNSNPPALRAAVRSFLAEPGAGRKVVVCADMLELGENAPRLHREIGSELADLGVHTLVAVGQLARHLIEGWHESAAASQAAFYFRSADEAWEPLWRVLSPGDAVLLKGSRQMALETITAKIAERLGRGGKEVAA